MRTCVVVVGCVVLGCGGSSGPPIKTARQVEQRNDGVPVFPVADAPAASDPSAAATAAKILAAHTGNDPGLVDKVKTVLVVRDGVMHPRPGEGAGDLPVKFEFTASWPDTCKYAYIPSGGTAITMLRVNARSTRFPDQPPLSETDIAAFHRDAFGEWLLLCVPLGDPKAVFAPGPELSVDGKKYPGIRLWMKDAPQVILSYDPATFRVVKWTYNGLSMSGVDAQIELVTSNYGTAHGLVYPGTIVVRHAGQPMITFNKSTVAFPKAFDKDTFTLPKK